MIFKRIISNLIDFIFFLLIFFLSFKISGLEYNISHSYFFYFSSFCIVFLIPIFFIKNTIGKEIFNLRWKKTMNLKLKLILKYFLYYLIVAPTFSIPTALISFPYLKNDINGPDLVLSFKLLLVFFSTDLIVFILSLGKFHLLDYLLNLKIKKYKFVNTKNISLGIVYLFFGIFFITNMVQYKNNLSSESVENSAFSIIHKEQYPKDLFFGNDVFVTKENSIKAFTPTKPLSFLFSNSVKQKTLYLNLPEQIFNSEFERQKVCIDLINKSNLNDYFYRYDTEQTRIILTNIKMGKYLEGYKYYYIYYFENKLPEWGVYGGIKADTTTANKYVSFINKYNRDRIVRIENSLNLSWSEIIDKCSNDPKFEESVQNLLTGNINISADYETLRIKIDSSELELDKIKFSDTKLNGYVSFNFPIKNPEHSINTISFGNYEIIENDENVDFLKHLRKEVTIDGI